MCRSLIFNACPTGVNKFQNIFKMYTEVHLKYLELYKVFTPEWYALHSNVVLWETEWNATNPKCQNHILPGRTIGQQLNLHKPEHRILINLYTTPVFSHNQKGN